MLQSQLIRALSVQPPLLPRICAPRRLVHHDSPIERLKRPSRGGQNLTDRYIRLEKSLRGKEAQIKRRDDAEVNVEPVIQPATNNTSKIFRGFIIPEKPKEPEADGARHFLLLIQALTSRE